MINFRSFREEFVKIAEANVQHAYKGKRRKIIKGVGAAGGAGAGAAAGSSLARTLGRRARIAAALGGAALGGLGGRDVGGGLHRALG
jgi:hypothetical protein